MLLRLSLNQGPLADIETQYQQGCVKWKEKNFLHKLGMIITIKKKE